MSIYDNKYFMLLHGKFRKTFPVFFSVTRNLKRYVRRITRKISNNRNVITKIDIKNQLLQIGIQKGDILLVHSSMRKIGNLEHGPITIINALVECLGEEGTLLMPSFPVREDAAIKLQDQNFLFDRKHSPSQMGVITEEFRKMPHVSRSFHPSHPVCAYGKLAIDLTKDHFGEITPFTKNSPFRKVSEYQGKILLIGVTMNQSLTNLHTLEDEVEIPDPIYLDKTCTIKMIDYDGSEYFMETKLHNSEMSLKRDCDALKPLFISKGVLVECFLGKANCLLIDAKKLFDVMVEEYHTNKVTMYHPTGNIKVT